MESKKIIIPKRLQEDVLVKDITVRFWYCRNCETYFKPKFFLKKLESFDIKQLLQEQEICTNCHSRWWRIWKKNRIKCWRCGYVMDQSKYTGGMPNRCPNCKHRRYLYSHFEDVVNISKELREQFIAEAKELMSKKKKKIIKSDLTDLEVTPFHKSIMDSPEKLGE